MASDPITKWTVWHGDHVAFFYDGPTSGPDIQRAWPPSAQRVRYPNGLTSVPGDVLRCAGCAGMPVWIYVLRWEGTTVGTPVFPLNRVIREGDNPSQQRDALPSVRTRYFIFAGVAGAWALGAAVIPDGFMPAIGRTVSNTLVTAIGFGILAVGAGICGYFERH